MLARTRFAVAALAVLALVAGSVTAASPVDSLKKGTPDIKSAGALAFGPEGILFVADTAGAAIFALDTGERAAATPVPIKVEKVNEKVAALLGTTAQEVAIRDVVVNPISGNAYLSVERGRGPTATPVILRVGASGKLEEVGLKDVKFAKVSLGNVPAEGARNRAEAITDLEYVEGRLFVAGLSNEEFASKLRSIPFPFSETDKGTSVEIFHGAHGRLETNAPVRTFVSYLVNGEANLLAAYTCTPLVKFPVSDLKPGAKVRGVTVAELGNRNRPLDMVVYTKGGKDYLLLTNSARGVMKIPTAGLATAEGITTRPNTDTAGVGYETIKELTGVEQMDKLGKDHVVLLRRAKDGALNLETVAVP